MLVGDYGRIYAFRFWQTVNFYVNLYVNPVVWTRDTVLSDVVIDPFSGPLIMAGISNFGINSQGFGIGYSNNLPFIRHSLSPQPWYGVMFLAEGTFFLGGYGFASPIALPNVGDTLTITPVAVTSTVLGP